MIRLANKDDRELVVSICSEDDCNGTPAISSFISHFSGKNPEGWDYYDIWLDGEEGYVLCRQGRLFRLVGQPKTKEGWQELHDLIPTLPVGFMTAKAAVMEKYRELFGQDKPEEPEPATPQMTYNGSDKIEADPDVTVQDPTTGEMYDIRASVDRGFAEYFTREECLRRVCSGSYGGTVGVEIRRAGKPVAEGSVDMPQGSRYALVCDIYTLPEHRGNGYATKIVKELCRLALEQGKIPVLECANPELEKFYNRLGFTVSGLGLDMGINE